MDKKPETVDELLDSIEPMRYVSAGDHIDENASHASEVEEVTDLSTEAGIISSEYNMTVVPKTLNNQEQNQKNEMLEIPQSDERKTVVEKANVEEKDIISSRKQHRLRRLPIGVCIGVLAAVFFLVYIHITPMQRPHSEQQTIRSHATEQKKKTNDVPSSSNTNLPKESQISQISSVFDDDRIQVQYTLRERQNKKTVSLVFQSKSSQFFSFGWVKPSQFILRTDQGDYVPSRISPAITATNKAFDAIPLKITLTYPSAPGIPAQLIITNFYPLYRNPLTQKPPRAPRYFGHLPDPGIPPETLHIDIEQ